MKKFLSVLLTVVLVLSLAACGKGTGDAGFYVLTSLSGDGMTLDKDTLELLGLYGTMYLELREDGTGVLSMGDGDDLALTWKKGVITADGESSKYTLKGDELTIEIDGAAMVFTREDKSAFSSTSGGSSNLGGLGNLGSDDTLLDFWNGEWYGWWAMLGADGEYEELSGQWWDTCGVIDIGDDYTGTVELWDEDGDPYNLLCSVDVSLSGSGTSQYGTVMSEDGWFGDCLVGHADWIVDPGLADYDNMIWIDGSYEDDYGSFTISIYLKPWGERWDDVEAAQPQDVPYYYYDWYLPLIEAGEPMPDVIGDMSSVTTPSGGFSGGLDDDGPGAVSGMIPIGDSGVLGVILPDGFSYNDGWYCYSDSDFETAIWLADAKVYKDQAELELYMTDKAVTETATLGGRTVYITEDPDSFYGAETVYYVVLDGLGDCYACSIKVSSNVGDMAATQTPAIRDMIASIAEMG